MFTRILKRSLVTLLAAGLAFGLAQRIEIEFWHGLTPALGDPLEDMVDRFNDSQDLYHVNAGYKGGYDDVFNMTIAAVRAGTPPDIVQMFEVGTGQFIYAERVIIPVHQLMADSGVPFDPNIYLPAIKGYYSLPDGSMMAFPFNSSTAVMWVNDDALTAAGIDPTTVELETWAQVRSVAKQVVDAGAANCGFSMAWPTWTQFEQFSAVHDLPYSTLSNGFEGLGAELLINSPVHVQHVQNLLDMQAEGSFMYGGRGNAGDTNFVSGECAIVHGSSALVGRVNREVEFNWTIHPLPYYEDVPNVPINSIIGGAAFWVIEGGQSPEKLRGIAEMFAFMSTMEETEWWHKTTGYLPIRFGVFDKLQAEGFYEANPGYDVPYLQLTRSEPTANSMGFRLGNMPTIRAVIEEEIEIAFDGGQTAQQALDNAVKRGNEVLRAF
ncbi:MAG: extracellular solute-binding protein, partial [Trueperaceae bacterium]|nr:extracellular solute-binding protein [Trueperaceae bacterium]